MIKYVAVGQSLIFTKFSENKHVEIAMQQLKESQFRFKLKIETDDMIQFFVSDVLSEAIRIAHDFFQEAPNSKIPKINFGNIDYDNYHLLVECMQVIEKVWGDGYKITADKFNEDVEF